MFGAISGKHALLLQGPMGPFFWRLRKDLKLAGARVSKVNFNVSDTLFYPDHQAISYRGTLRDWPVNFKQILRKHKIDIIFLFGDTRPYHLGIIEIALSMGVPVYCFEEGYLRPDYITMERCGVNGFSNLSRDPNFYLSQPAKEFPEPQHVESGFGRTAWYASMYSLFLTLFAFCYPHYQHHRPLHAIMEGLYWMRAFFRKNWFGFKERKILALLSGKLSKRYFFVPLQVHNDAQIAHHSKYNCIKEFMEEVVSSFAAQAREEDYLVIKHHPLDRGYRDYTRYLRELSRKYGIQDRFVYVHDLHLPTLLKHARGTVLVNSTVGLSSMLHNTPVKTMGCAIYDMPGLVCQQSLNTFWHEPGQINHKLYKHFRSWLLEYNQLNGNFYKPLAAADNQTGVIWNINKPFDDVFKDTSDGVVLIPQKTKQLVSPRINLEQKAS